MEHKTKLLSVKRIIRFSLLNLVILATNAQNVSQANTDFNFNWNFKLENNQNSNWKKVNLPHDWSVEASFDSIKGEGATGYLPGGMGWYKKNFNLKPSKNHTNYILFDGIYNNSEIWLNDKKLGTHPYGYSPFYYDLSASLKSNGANEIKVKVDRTRYADSRWYTGSGIYRNVNLITKYNLHIPIWGTYITTPKVDSQKSSIHLEIKVKNNFDKLENFELNTVFLDNKGVKVAEKSITGKVNAHKEEKFIIESVVNNPKLWDIDNPNLYTAVTTIKQNGKVIDENSTTFGIRTIKFDANTGFYLNGKNMKIKGVCLHHDAGLVGAAVPKDVWRRRFEKLKEAGVNAIRISHNPGSDEFISLCDEMGIMVQDEFFDEWDNPKDKRLNMKEQSVDAITRGYTEHFQEWAERDLKNTMLAHRNHPSIIQWSIGNEIEWTYDRNAQATGFFNNMDWSGNYFWSLPPNSIEKIKEKLQTLPREKYDIGVTAKKLAKWTKEMDTTRYVIANCILPSSSYESGYADALDIIGYSYRRVVYDYGHKNYPNLPIMGTENVAQWHEWKAIMERPFISGTFLWTGIDYMGESNKKWPEKGTPSGILDYAGFEKPSYHMMKSLWNAAPELYIATQTVDKSTYKIDDKTGEPVEKKKGAWEHALWVWHDVNEHWEYNQGAQTIVEVYSNCEEVELFLNDRSLGKKKLIDFEDHIYKWAVPFEAGKLTAKGTKSGSSIITERITPKQAHHIQLTTDKKELRADGYEVAHIVAQIMDANNNPVKTINPEITFTVDGNLKVLGVDNGAVDNVQKIQSNKIIPSQGRCLLIVQSKKGEAVSGSVKASAKELSSNTIQLTNNNLK
ncbi:glycoside hydrolase family 2 TIM barrel-domain containing protein [Flavobacterium sp. NG2]|uniref:glycoside hydrolase family 2 TIM barrel-domain containing protein n=1 Tax=Flavobacterium sp. NG2 TaxID=3097547 RepID=UPI002A82DFD4|nr:glycoside hydrolase family 2 TIM barrel-domain containing protein [Flavobacterium sp. NG2]WPR73135.1 glycoside hydrolase family 2 TIM barrel-domain containing protein [Flavobacterium sp. NG2]